MSGQVENLRSRAARGYLEAKVRSATPAELIGLLYEGLAQRIRRAAAAIDEHDLAEKGEAIGRALAIVAELRGSLDHHVGGEVATNLERIYVYWTQRLTEANVQVTRAPLDQIASQLTSLRGAWAEVTAAGTPAPVEAAAGGR